MDLTVVYDGHLTAVCRWCGCTLVLDDDLPVLAQLAEFIRRHAH